MLNDYYDAPGNRGRSCLGDAKASDEEQAEELSKMIELAHCRGFQAGIHAIGDRAVEETIKAIIAVKEKFPQNDLRHYIIHAESLGWPHQAKRAARYKIPYSVQPAFAAHEIEPTIGCIGPGVSGVLISELPWTRELFSAGAPMPLPEISPTGGWPCSRR